MAKDRLEDGLVDADTDLKAGEEEEEAEAEAVDEAEVARANVWADALEGPAAALRDSSMACEMGKMGRWGDGENRGRVRSAARSSSGGGSIANGDGGRGGVNLRPEGFGGRLCFFGVDGGPSWRFGKAASLAGLVT